MFNNLKFTIPMKSEFLSEFTGGNPIHAYNKVTPYAIFTGFGSQFDTDKYLKRDKFIIMSYSNYYYNHGDGFSYYDGKEVTFSYKDISAGVRPKIKYSSIKRMSIKIINSENSDLIDDRIKSKYFDVEFGEYPQNVVTNSDLLDELEELYNNNKLCITGKNYIPVIYHHKKSFPEYIYKGRKFIRMPFEIKDIGNFEFGKYYWIEVEPVIWTVNPKNNVAISKYVLFAGVSYNDLKEYFEKFFSKDIIPSKAMLLKQSEVDNSSDVKELLSTNTKEIDIITLKLNSLEVKDVDMTSLESLVNYGNELSINIDLINEEYKKLVVNSLLEVSLSDVENVVSEIKNIKPVNNKPKFIQKFSIRKNNMDNNQKEINLGILNRLNRSINNGINSLNMELVGYDHIKRYLEIYIEKLKVYIELTKKAIDSETQIINDTKENNSERLRHNANLEILKSKLNSFQVSLSMRMSELMQIHQIIFNHFITINSLRTAKENLVPLIANELVVRIGDISEKNFLELSDCIVGLFNGILTKNKNGTLENLERLKQSSLPSETISNISNELLYYLNSSDSSQEKVGESFNALDQKILKISY